MAEVQDGSPRNLGDPDVVVCNAGPVPRPLWDQAHVECLRRVGTNCGTTHEARARIHKREGADSGKS
jgi:hypothetical protein